MDGELVFTVRDSKAVPLRAVSLADAGLMERQHLQEWVLSNPAIIGDDVVIVTSEFDRWQSRDGRTLDRLDVLGLSSDGRLVVAELKRGEAPDTTDLQALKYAAMASRLDADSIIEAFISFKAKQQIQSMTQEQAVQELSAHAGDIYDLVFHRPKIVLVASGFAPSVSNTAVWLSENGIDIALVKIQAYQTDEGPIVVTVSRQFPIPDVEDFLVLPARTAAGVKSAMPHVEWTEQDIKRLAEVVTNETILATMDACAETPGEWVAAEVIMERTGVPAPQHKGAFGGFGTTLRRRFDRANPPFELNYNANGSNSQNYLLDKELAAIWQAIRSGVAKESPEERDD